MTPVKAGITSAGTAAKRAAQAVQWFIPLLPLSAGILLFATMYDIFAVVPSDAEHVKWHIIKWTFSLPFLVMGIAVGALLANGLHLPWKLLFATKFGRKKIRFTPGDITRTETMGWRIRHEVIIRRFAAACTVLAALSIATSIGVVLF